MVALHPGPDHLQLPDPHGSDSRDHARDLARWDQLVHQVRANHYRKVGFIREFEKVVTGVTPGPEPTFLAKARARWVPPE